MFKVKICGITTVDDALAVALAGADAVGLNFYPPSPRCIEPAVAERIVNALPAGIVKVGVFVDQSAEQICRLYDELSLDMAQLHGHEPPEFILQLGGRRVMRAFRIGPDGIAPVSEYLDCCRKLGALPTAVLFDASVAGSMGGTGRLSDWNAARQYVAQGNCPPLVLAGGLTPANVAEAIRAVRPAAVDTAGGVESAPGRKDHAALRTFVQAAQQTFVG